MLKKDNLRKRKKQATIAFAMATLSLIMAGVMAEEPKITWIGIAIGWIIVFLVGFYNVKKK